MFPLSMPYFRYIGCRNALTELYAAIIIVFKIDVQYPFKQLTFFYIFIHVLSYSGRIS